MSDTSQAVSGRQRPARRGAGFEPALAAARGEPLTDAALVARAREGDPNAFERLVRQHERRAFALAVSLVKDEHDAHEIVQEAFLRVYRSLPSFAGDSSFFTWLYRIVSNLAVDFLRRPQRRERERLDEAPLEHLLRSLRGAGCDPFEALANKELKATLERSVQSLPAYHRHVIEMREMQGLSYEEMAEQMGVSKGTIMSRLFHARQKLQRSLRDSYVEG